MTAQNLDAQQAVNWSKIAFMFGAAVSAAGWIVFGAQMAQRLTTQEHLTRPLANGDLIKVQTDVAWIRAELERERDR